ncbi:MAG: hypothetical protein KAR17_18725 [Cyclobacteriaceae bacterium]|nr:hypothetical protein [Cyclobacteriaceae bacterium]
MKTLKTKLLTFILPFILLFGCQQNSQEITEQEKEEIISEIKEQWVTSLTGI